MENRDFYDIGMWVNCDFRNKGYAARIIAHLKGYCLEHNVVPICGCAVDNLASRKTLEKNGYISKHDLIEFEISKIYLGK
jgi:RimJ/RimL family protein N-acetyltransferase